MDLKEGKAKFIQSWGALASNWGVNRTMAQVHALLLISPEPLSSKQIMDELKISLGNANMNVRALLSWELIYKKLIPGERKEFFVAEKDMWLVTKRIIEQRKKKELTPMVQVLEEISEIEGNDPHTQEFVTVINDLKLYSNKANATLEMLLKTDSNWFTSTFLKMIK